MSVQKYTFLEKIAQKVDSVFSNSLSPIFHKRPGLQFNLQIATFIALLVVGITPVWISKALIPLLTTLFSTLAISIHLLQKERLQVRNNLQTVANNNLGRAPRSTLSDHYLKAFETALKNSHDAFFLLVSVIGTLLLQAILPIRIVASLLILQFSSITLGILKNHTPNENIQKSLFTQPINPEPIFGKVNPEELSRNIRYLFGVPR